MFGSTRFGYVEDDLPPLLTIIIIIIINRFV